MIYEILDNGKNTVTVPFYIYQWPKGTASSLYFEIYDVINDNLIDSGYAKFYGEKDLDKTYSYNFPNGGSYKLKILNTKLSSTYFEPVEINLSKDANLSSISGKITPHTAVHYGFRRDTKNGNSTGRITYLKTNASYTPMSVTSSGTTYGSWGSLITNFLDLVRVPTKNFNNSSSKTEILSSTDYTKLANGTTASNISTASSGYDFFVRLGKSDTFRYTYCYEDSQYQYIYFCNYPLTDDYKAYPFYDENGEENKYLYLGMFSAFYNSTTGKFETNGISQKATVGKTLQQIETACSLSRDDGNSYWPMSYSQYNYIRNLLTLFAKTDNLQDAYGQGVGYSSGQQQVNEVSNKLFWNQNDTKKPVYALGMQDLWGNGYHYMAGIALSYNTIIGRPYPPYQLPAQSLYNNYKQTDAKILSASVSGKYLQDGIIDSNFGWWLPTNATASASSTTYYSDTLVYTNLTSALLLCSIKGSWGETTQNGPYGMHFTVAPPTTAISNASVRISFVANK